MKDKRRKITDDFIIDDSLCPECEHKATCDEENKKGCFGYLSEVLPILKQSAIDLKV